MWMNDPVRNGADFYCNSTDTDWGIPFNVNGPEVTIEQMLVGKDIPVQYMDGEI